MARTIKSALSATVLFGTLSLGIAFAQGPAPTTTAPATPAAEKQKKAEEAKVKKQMRADCTKQAGDQKLTGAARTKFMKECTSKM